MYIYIYIYIYMHIVFYNIYIYIYIYIYIWGGLVFSHGMLRMRRHALGNFMSQDFDTLVCTFVVEVLRGFGETVISPRKITSICSRITELIF